MIIKRHLDRNQQWFPEARFGMFIHFGLYALLGRGEWVMYNEDIPREEYGKLARRFNPHKFDAGEWVAAAQRAGCRYMTVTAKHHDGFCLFDSALTDYKITNTPFQRDLIGELIAACRQAGMRLCLYYSQPDWRHKNFVHRPQAFKDLQYARPDDEPNWPAFLEYYLGQVRELCSNYGKIDGIWFDGVQRTEKEWQGRRVYEMIRALQPHAVVNDRAGYGDFFTPERSLSLLPAAAGYMVEACQSVAHGAWGYQTDTALYSSENLLHSMLKMAAANGNYLLNVGPKADGSLPQDWLARMYDIGDWLAEHGKSVYGTQGCPLREESPTRLYTRSGKRLYLHLLAWPESDRIELANLRALPKSARMLKTGQRLQVVKGEGKVELRGLPALPPALGANVIEMTFDTENMLRKPARQQAAGVVPCVTLRQRSGPAAGPVAIVLSPDQATLKGFGFKGNVLRTVVLRPAEVEVIRPAETAIAAFWTPEQAAQWRVQCGRAGRYRVAVELACPAPFDGTGFVLEAAGQKLAGIVPATSSQTDFVPVELGELRLPKGETIITLRPTKPKYAFYFAQVRGVQLQSL